MAVKTRSFKGVVLCKPGTWISSDGREVTITRDHLSAAVRAHQDPAFSTVPVKLGHTDTRFDGEPAKGLVTNLRQTSDGALVGDIERMPEKLAEIAEVGYPERSAELRWGARGGRGSYACVLTGLALLGEKAPAVKGMGDLHGMFFDEAPQGIWVVATDLADGTGHDADTTSTGGHHVEEQKLREMFGIGADVNLDEALQAVATRLSEGDTGKDPDIVKLSKSAYEDLLARAEKAEEIGTQLSEQRAQKAVETALSEGRILPKDQPLWLGRLKSDFERESVRLSELMPVFNTRQRTDLSAGSDRAGNESGHRGSLTIDSPVSDDELFDLFPDVYSKTS